MNFRGIVAVTLVSLVLLGCGLIGDGTADCEVAPDPLITATQDNWQEVLGCPTSTVETASYSWMAFENGSMLLNQASSTIIVLYDDGTLEQYPVPDTSPSPVQETPPDGLLSPTGSFAALWQAEVSVREGLGWATTSETTYEGVQQAFIDKGTQIVVLGNGDLIGLFPFSDKWARLPLQSIPGYYGSQPNLPDTPLATVAVLGSVGLLVVGGTLLTRRKVA